NGTVITLSNFFMPPSITGIVPSNTAAGTWIKLTGVNFTNASSVLFNGADAADFVVTNNTIIGAQVPAGVSTGPMSVTTPWGTTNSGNLLFYALPVINSFNPTHGLPGDTVTILGTNFLGTSSVKFAGISAAIVSVANNQIVVRAPTNSPVTAQISVTAPA